MNGGEASAADLKKPQRQALFNNQRRSRVPADTLNALQQSYLVQYTALIIIILAFIVGSYATRGTTVAAESSGAPTSTAPLEYPIATINWAELLKDGKINSAIVEALASILTQHDLFLAGTIVMPTTEAALGLISELEAELNRQGVPRSAIKLFATAGRSKGWMDSEVALVSLRRMGT